MIELTRLNGNPLAVNSDLIKWAEAAPDTMLTLINGEKVVVRESCSEVIERIIASRARLLAEVVKIAPAAANLMPVAGSAVGNSALSLHANDGALRHVEEIEADLDPAQRRRKPEL